MHHQFRNIAQAIPVILLASLYFGYFSDALTSLMVVWALKLQEQSQGILNPEH